jgi:hypothetical protein
MNATKVYKIVNDMIAATAPQHSAERCHDCKRLQARHPAAGHNKIVTTSSEDHIISPKEHVEDLLRVDVRLAVECATTHRPKRPAARARSAAAASIRSSRSITRLVARPGMIDRGFIEDGLKNVPPHGWIKSSRARTGEPGAVKLLQAS